MSKDLHTLSFTIIEIDRLVSMVNSYNIRLKISGDWPEEMLDKEILKKIVIKQGEIRRKS